MSTLTVRLSPEEKAELELRAQTEGKSTSEVVRELIRSKPYETAADVLSDLDRWMGHPGLKITRRK